jgi:hypothetical protein
MAEANSPLAGRVMLVVDDEPLVGLDVADALMSCGGRVVCVRSAVEALASVDPREGWSACCNLSRVGKGLRSRRNRPSAKVVGLVPMPDNKPE